eukprot:7278162-Pyramimonas_sp.AAC.1
MDSIMQWKSELEHFQKEQLGTLQAKFKYIEEIHQKAKMAMQAPKKKRKVEAGADGPKAETVEEEPPAAETPTTATAATASNGAGAAAINPEDEKKKIRDANLAALEQARAERRKAREAHGQADGLADGAGQSGL